MLMDLLGFGPLNMGKHLECHLFFSIHVQVFGMPSVFLYPHKYGRAS
jgi:hypothetical protein